MPPADVTLERTLPNSIDSERAVPGAILLDHKAIFPATEVLTVEDLYLEWHHEIFRAMLALAGAAEIAIGKQRNGMTGNTRLSFRKRITRFSDLQKEGY